MEEFSRSFEVRWADLDPNFHVRHSVYPDYCATTRFEFLKSHGFGMKKFAELQIGPILFKETICFFKELLSDDKVKVNVSIPEMSESGHKWTIHHELYRETNNEKVATVTVEGAWMNTKLRKVTAPPKQLMEVFQKYVVSNR